MKVMRCGAGILLPVCVALAGCASGIATYETTYPLVGFNAPPAEIRVVNSTPLTAKILAVNQYVTTLEPGESVSDTGPLPLEEQPEPVLALMYASGKYVGVARAILNLRAGGTATWEIKTEDVVFAREYPANLPVPDASETEKTGAFPHILGTRSTVVQFVSNFPRTVQLTGSEAGSSEKPTVVRLGGVFVVEASRESFEGTGKFSLQAQYWSAGRVVKSESYHFTVSPDAATAEQIILQ